MTENKASPKMRFTALEAIVWIVFATAAFFFTFEFDGPLPTYEFGAAFWPRVVLAGIMVAAGVLLVGSLLLGDGKSSSAVDPRLTDALPEDASHVTRKTVIIFAVPLLYVYAIHKLGFLLVTPFFLMGYMFLLGVRSRVMLLSVTFGLYIAIVVIFVKLIFTPLPQGSGYFYTLNGHLLGLIQ